MNGADIAAALFLYAQKRLCPGGMEKVDNYIAEQLAPHEGLNPKEIYRGYAAGNEAERSNLCGGMTLKSVIIWQYRTLYTEVFMIEEGGDTV